MPLLKTILNKIKKINDFKAEKIDVENALYAGYSSDLNGITKTSNCSFNATTLNIPEPNLFGNVLTLVGGSIEINGAEWWAFQYVICTNNTIYLRHYLNGKWQEWERK